MSKKKESRRDQIVELVDERQYISIEDLVKEINISKVTIRRDLTDLEREGRLIRKFGGAASIKEFFNPRGPKKAFNAIRGNDELDDLRVVPHEHYNSIDNDPLVDFEYNPKQQIAREAVELIKNSNRILIDAGSTTGQMINFIGLKEKLTIMTNSLETGYKLSQIPSSRRPTILLTGGVYDQKSDTFQGPFIREVLKQYNFEQLFIGADGIDFEKGTMTNFSGNIAVSQIMAKISDQVIVLVESNKIGRKMPDVELPWDSIDIVITDNKILSLIHI